MYALNITGDSGGPLYRWYGHRAYLIGVVSRGTGCAHFNHPGIFTRIIKHIDWILRKIKTGNCTGNKRKEIQKGNFS